MDIKYIDINSDVGEGIGNENVLLSFISSCNIACGGHAGNKAIMSEITKLAIRYQVKIGAHPSYPDRNNFGRVTMEISEAELIKSIQFQIQSLISVLESEGATLHHIKPHGALYNDLANDKNLSLIFLSAIMEFKREVFLYVPFNSTIEKEAIKEGFKIKREAFADRNYNSDLSLVSRKSPDALIRDPKKVIDHLIRMVKENKVSTLDGEIIPIFADTFCVHGDTPDAIQIVDYLSKELPKKRIKFQK